MKKKVKLSKTDKRLKTLAKETEKQKQSLLEHLVQYPIIQAACRKAGVGRATYYAWCAEDKGFAKLAARALEEGKRFICDMAESQMIRKIQDGDKTMLIFWLKNHHSDYKESDYHFHKHELPLPEEFTPEEKAKMKAAFINAGFAALIKEKEAKKEKK